MQSSETHSWRFYYRPCDTWEAMYNDCRKAQESIELEQYILEDDSLGQRFMELFIDKAKAGLKVFLICDTFGSLLITRSPLVRQLRQHGGHVHFYNAPKDARLFMPWRWLPRTHTKTLLIDSTIAYTGGVCMAAHMCDWRDTHARLTGPVTQQVREAFDDIENRIQHKRSRGIQPAEDTPFLYVINRPNKSYRTIYKKLSKAVREAEHTIYIASAYFFPNRRFIRLLRQAHARGVNICLMVPTHSDLLFADWVFLSYAPRYLKAGIRIFHYPQTVLHSKMAIIDDCWATLGSANFDTLSFFYNREANVIITECGAVAELRNRFLDDLQHCTEFTHDAWRSLPLWKKIAGFSGRLLRMFLR